MHFSHLEIKELVLIKPRVFDDERGYFFESFRQESLEEFIGYKINFCQDNESKSSKGVLRGLHYQLPPFAQSKLVRVISGAVLDVAVDMRKNSPTFGKYIKVKLSAQNKLQLLIPRGFAHGFLTLEDNTIFIYKVDNYYNPASERAIAYNDPQINIAWDIQKPILSPKDEQSLTLKALLESNDVFEYGVNYYE